MAAAKEGGSVAVYTDGSTVPGERPTAGWGWAQYEEGGTGALWGVGLGIGRGKERADWEGNRTIIKQKHGHC